MPNERKALIGFHHPAVIFAFNMRLKRFDINTESAANLDEMLGKMRYDASSKILPYSVHGYNIIAMDINLNYKGAQRIDSGQQVFELIKSDIDSGLVRYIAFSAIPSVVEQAIKNGIPTLDKGDLVKFDNLARDPAEYKAFYESLRR